jgi:hypothetical protein
MRGKRLFLVDWAVDRAIDGRAHVVALDVRWLFSRVGLVDGGVDRGAEAVSLDVLFPLLLGAFQLLVRHLVLLSGRRPLPTH